MTSPEQPRGFEPRLPLLVATIVFVIAALSLCYPMLSGQFIAGDDQVIAGYGFRLFGAEFFRTHGRIPEWNPYLFGGMPFIAAMHGDIFYPTAWLRWFLPTDVVMTFSFFIHLVIAGVSMYALLRALRLSWTASVVAGVGYELSGILASMLNNGHDGKLFVSALAPFALLALLRAIRHGKLSSFGVFALIIGLCMLSPHYQMTYYLLVACGLWTLWLTFFDGERERPRSPVRDMSLSIAGVVLGIGIGMIQGLPFLKYVPYSPRAEGSASSGWDYATSYALPIEELAGTVLPQFNGMLDHYWGGNYFKSHSEYLGAIIVMLAIVGFGVARRRKLLAGLAPIAILFLLIAFGGHTPFYRLWYEVMPMMQKVRAAGMAFFLVALPVCVLAGLGVDRLLRGEVTKRQLYWVTGVFGMLAVLGVVGMLQGVSEVIAGGIPPVPGRPTPLEQAMGNSDQLRAGSLRLLLVVLLAGGVFYAIRQGMLRTGGAALALTVLVLGDNWSVLKHYADFLPPAEVTYADDQLAATMKKTPLPFRTFEPSGGYGQVGVYQGAWLMAEHVPTLFGYHGNESRFFDELFGEKNKWEYQLSPSLLDLYAIKYIVANQDVSAGFTNFPKTLGPVAFSNLTGRKANAAFLFEKATEPQWVRVVPAAVKVPEAQIIPTVIDPRFPVSSVVVYSDTMTVEATQLTELPPPTPVTATLASWDAGAMTVNLTGTDTRTTYLLVAENWYPGWTAMVDGKPTPTHRANHAMLSVALPPGAKSVVLAYHTPGYDTGKMITVISLVGALGMVVAGRVRRRPADV